MFRPEAKEMASFGQSVAWGISKQGLGHCSRLRGSEKGLYIGDDVGPVDADKLTGEPPFCSLQDDVAATGASGRACG